MKQLKIALVLLVAVALIVGMTGCSLLGGGFDAGAYVKGLIDTNYLNTHDPEYMEMLSESMTEEQLEQQYYTGVGYEAEYFMSYCSIVDVSDETVQRIVDMYDEIYSHTKFEVGEVVETENGYLVSLTIYPIDIIYRSITEDGDTISTIFQSRVDSGEYDNLTDLEFEEAWADVVLDHVEGYLPTIDYLEPQTISVQIYKDENGIYTIDQNDWQRVDTLIIQY